MTIMDGMGMLMEMQLCIRYQILDLNALCNLFCDFHFSKYSSVMNVALTDWFITLPLYRLKTAVEVVVKTNHT